MSTRKELIASIAEAIVTIRYGAPIGRVGRFEAIYIDEIRAAITEYSLPDTPVTWGALADMLSITVEAGTEITADVAARLYTAATLETK